jgi:hypothetical protein
MKSLAPRLLACLGLAVAAAFLPISHGQDAPRPNKRSEFMRLKLEFSKNVLEGLAREDYPLIARNARDLKALSLAAEWEAPEIPHVEEYLPHTTDFQRSADDLMKKARERNLDGATLAFTRMTMNCVDCHKYVRSVSK